MKKRNLLSIALCILALSLTLVSCKKNKDSAASEPAPSSSSTVPTGALKDVFSVSETRKVYFSKGNLQYQASTNTWRFAEHQFDFVGDDDAGNVYENYVKCNNELCSSTYEGWIDLFGWGTSGYDHGAVCYQPWAASKTYSDYNPYGSMTSNLFDNNGKADWGANPISNGGNKANKWRTLTHDEWVYLLFERTTNSDYRFVKVRIGRNNGVIIFPDNWKVSYYEFNSVNEEDSDFTDNILTIIDWEESIESHGAVYLPAAGVREGLAVKWIEHGYYWSSTCFPNGEDAYSFNFDPKVDPYNNGYRQRTRSVRLVRNK